MQKKENPLLYCASYTERENISIILSFAILLVLSIFLKAPLQYLKSESYVCLLK